MGPHTETSSENTTQKADKREIAVGDGKGAAAQPGDPGQQHPWEVLLTVATSRLEVRTASYLCGLSPNNLQLQASRRKACLQNLRTRLLQIRKATPKQGGQEAAKSLRSPKETQ